MACHQIGLLLINEDFFFFSFFLQPSGPSLVTALLRILPCVLPAEDKHFLL